jgi:type II secretory pathway component PulF
MRAGINAGMLHHQSLELAAAACGNRHFGARIRAAAADLASGKLPNLTQAFARLGFKLEVVQLCQNGEISGQLDDTMGRCADFQRTAFQERTLWTARIATGTLYALAVLAAAATVIGMYAGYLNTVKEISEGME